MAKQLKIEKDLLDFYSLSKEYTTSLDALNNVITPSRAVQLISNVLNTGLKPSDRVRAMWKLLPYTQKTPQGNAFWGSQISRMNMARPLEEKARIQLAIWKVALIGQEKKTRAQTRP